jgi:DNA-binding NtrC family response regulator
MLEGGSDGGAFCGPAARTGTRAASAKRARKREEKQRPAAARAPAVRPWRVLVVEDSVDLAVVLERVIRSVARGAELDWVETAAAGAHRLHTRAYDLVLADYFLGGVRSGLTLYEECNRHQKAVFAMMSSLKVDSFLALTGEREIPFLPKPFTVNECSAFLQAALQTQGEGRPS